MHRRLRSSPHRCDDHRPASRTRPQRPGQTSAARPGDTCTESTGSAAACGWSARRRPYCRGAREQAAREARLRNALNAAASDLALQQRAATPPDCSHPVTPRRAAAPPLELRRQPGPRRHLPSDPRGHRLDHGQITPRRREALAASPSPVLRPAASSIYPTTHIVAALHRPARARHGRRRRRSGAAICAAVGHGIYPDWDQATEAMVRPAHGFAPDREPPALPAHQPGVLDSTATDPLFRSMADGLRGLGQRLRTPASTSKRPFRTAG